MSIISSLLERVAEAVERSSFLDRPADLVQPLTQKLPAGPAKDLLSGTAIGHPAHPALVAVPIGAFAGATVLDLTGGDAAAARRLIGFGILSALPAAATGASDWSDTLGSERRVGIAHAFLNTVALGLLARSWLARGDGSSSGGKLSALAGLSVMGASGWLGGHLAYAIGVGVDTTAFQKPPVEWTDACAESDLAEGTPHAVTVEDTPVLLMSRQGRLTAIGDRCTHRGGPLSEGPVVDGCIECPWHGSRFDLDTGAVVRGPATRPQPALQSRVVDGRIQVRRDEVRALRLEPTS